jgi:hypothetical protein
MENPPTLPDHQGLLINGRELAIRATKNDKTEMESSTIPSWRRLMFMVRLAVNVQSSQPPSGTWK